MMVRKAKAKPRQQETERGDQDQGRGHDERGDNRDSQNDKGGFVNLSKLFESRKNQDVLFGTMSEEYLDKLEGLLSDARDANKGITFFVMLNGKWGPSLSAAIARDRQEGRYGRGNFDNGNRSSDSGRGSGSRRWR